MVQVEQSTQGEYLEQNSQCKAEYANKVALLSNYDYSSMVESFKQTSSLITIRLLLLLYVAKGSSSLNFHEKRTILN
jgi:hypothetical protein